MSRPGPKPLTDETIRNRLEDYHFMRDTGEHPDRIAARLGMTPKTLEKFLWRCRQRGLLDHETEAA